MPDISSIGSWPVWTIPGNKKQGRCSFFRKRVASLFKRCMKNRVLFAFILMLISGTAAFAIFAAAQEEAAKEGPPASCLKCHGPYEKLIEKTAGYNAPSGETLSPHQYVPHAEKKDIPDCTDCHKPHPIPLKSKEGIEKPDTTWCYTSCHHMRNFESCKKCH
jgi:hypothetical protein